MVSHYNSRRPRLVLLLGTALYLQGALLPTTLAAKKVHPDGAFDISQTTNSLVTEDQEPQQGQHISNLQQDTQTGTTTAGHKNKDKVKSKKGNNNNKARKSAVDAKGIKARNRKQNKDRDRNEVKGSDESEENSDSDHDNNDSNNNNKKNNVNSYLADLWKGIVHLGEEPSIQAGIAALTFGIHDVTKHHGKRDVIQQSEEQDRNPQHQQQQQQLRLSEEEQGLQGEEGALGASVIKPLLLRPNHHKGQLYVKKKTSKMTKGLAQPDKSGGEIGMKKGNKNANGIDNEGYEYNYDDDFFEQDEGGRRKTSLPKIGQRVVFGKDGQVVGLAVDVVPGRPTGRGVSEAERFAKYGNEIMSAGESMMTAHDLANALTPAPHPFLVLEKRQRLGMLGADAARGGAEAPPAATVKTTMETQPLEMDMGLKRVRPVQEPEMDRAMDGDLRRNSKKDKDQEVDAGVRDFEKIAKKLRKENGDALQAFPAEEKKDKKADPFQKALDKIFGGEDTKERKKDRADPFEADVPKRHKNKDKVDDAFDNVPIEVQKEKKKEKHQSKNDRNNGGGEPAYKDPGPINVDMGKPKDKDGGKAKQEAPVAAVPDLGKGATPNQAGHPPDRTGPAPVTGNKKDSTTPGGFGTVPMFGPAQLDLGSGAAVSTVLSTWTCAFAMAAALMVTLVNC
ncbi:hypothetical protein EC968_009899 [Mortierella alpina]|nr:hypothetical protein EC968_009899 [Mortierella alpina]